VSTAPAATARPLPPPPAPASGPQRLQILIARAGVASRREAERLIVEGEVRVNGRVVCELGAKADPAADHVKVRGKLLPRARAFEYYALHKPTGVITTMQDPQGRPCVGDLVREMGSAVYPVGRLDWASSGLLLLTNDGELAQRLSHPRYHVEKRYLVKLSRSPDLETLERLRAGIRLEDGRTQPAFIAAVRGQRMRQWFEVRISEGRNRQVRRMFEAVGVLVEKLKRTDVGPLSLGDLPTGVVRRLKAGEIAALRRSVGLG
jgi:23S rRNA pseudouridine2605 synthase